MESDTEVSRLRAVMAALRDPKTGCPWDRVQDLSTIAPYTIEEAYEVADAILRDDRAALREELGDLLLQVVYHARLAEESGWFTFADVARGITEKMIRRHPHVFANASHSSWEDAKEGERRAHGTTGTLAAVPLGLPALARAHRLSARAARVGFDWPDVSAVMRKLDEEIDEVRAEFPDGDPARLSEEIGDVFFVLVNLARKLGLDSERCLREANHKFEERFEAVEQRLASKGKTPAEAGLDEMEREWQAVKETERRTRPLGIPSKDSLTIAPVNAKASKRSGRDGPEASSG